MRTTTITKELDEKEKRQKDELSFDYEEISALPCIMYECVEKGDLKRLQKLLNNIGKNYV